MFSSKCLPCGGGVDTTGDSPQAPEKTDILFVIDNSGSMAEEQDNLRDNFYRETGCPIDVNNVQPEFRNPTPDFIASNLQDCGFIQLLAAYENEFRVGVITTDTFMCDDIRGVYERNLGGLFDPENPGAENGRQTRLPQRGCLQGPDGQERKYLQRGDADIGEKFASILTKIRIYGSAWERGLDAATIFLDEAARKPAACESDSTDFIRDGAKLVVVFLTDEEDCSRRSNVGFSDEMLGSTCEEHLELADINDPVVPLTPAECYQQFGELTDVAEYAAILKATKAEESDVRVVVIAGGVGEQNNITPSKCDISNGQPVDTCTETEGQTINGACANDGTCCVADSGSRYYALAEFFDPETTLTDSICQQSFRTTLQNIVELVAPVDGITLANAPDNPEQIIVQQISVTGETVALERIPDDEVNPEALNGWQFEPPTTIRLYGDAVPQTGESVQALVNVVGETDGCGAASAEE